MFGLADYLGTMKVRGKENSPPPAYIKLHHIETISSRRLLKGVCTREDGGSTEQLLGCIPGAQALLKAQRKES